LPIFSAPEAFYIPLNPAREPFPLSPLFSIDPVAILAPRFTGIPSLTCEWVTVNLSDAENVATDAEIPA